MNRRLGFFDKANVCTHDSWGFDTTREDPIEDLKPTDADILFAQWKEPDPEYCRES